MGSGKGKSKRLRGSPSTNGPGGYMRGGDAKSAWSIWESFVDDAGVGEVNAFDYYFPGLLGKLGIMRVEPSYDQYAAVTSELFEDACDCGAIVLPRGYNAKSFQLKMRVSVSGPRIEVTNTVNGREHTYHAPPLNKHLLMEACGPDLIHLILAVKKTLN